jgi:hypothetical protein
MYKKATRDVSKGLTWRKSEMQRYKNMFPLATTILTKNQHSIQATSSRESSKLHPENEILPRVFMSSLRPSMLHGKVHPIPITTQEFFYENLRFMTYKSVTCKNNSSRYWKRPKTG